MALLLCADAAKAPSWRVASPPPMLHYHPNALHLLLPLVRERAITILHAPLTAARCTLVTVLLRET